jgi:pyruvate dehydrogenase E2 component (dihydrolipoamide acetyltransferase)
MKEGEIKEWKKNEGEHVEQGDILYILETEKVTYEVEAEVSGIMGPILAKVGDVVPVGEVVAYILEPGEQMPEDIGKETDKPAPSVVPKVKGSVEARERDTAKASPLARRLAEEHGVDIATVKGTGPGGRIVKDDILRASAEGKGTGEPVSIDTPAAISAEDTLAPLSNMRKTIARRMSDSFHTAPHFWLSVTADVTELRLAREKLISSVMELTGVRLTFTDLLIKAVAHALREQPEVNSTWADGVILLKGDVNIGIATSVEEGLLVPVIRQADQRSLSQIAAARADLVERARAKKITPDDLAGGTFTVNNLGMFGIENANVIINPPESAILLAGSIVDKPIVLDGNICVRPTMALTLAIDHRVLDGVGGARFLTRVKELVESPVLFLASL